MLHDGANSKCKTLPAHVQNQTRYHVDLLWNSVVRGKLPPNQEPSEMVNVYTTFRKRTVIPLQTAAIQKSSDNLLCISQIPKPRAPRGMLCGQLFGKVDREQGRRRIRCDDTLFSNLSRRLQFSYVGKQTPSSRVALCGWMNLLSLSENRGRNGRALQQSLKWNQQKWQKLAEYVSANQIDPKVSGQKSRTKF
ncbi:Hypothetical_protein [Hexamita inflata]|uniref:Hypothetical_protein n=1 Tax=Hexamita inflata TaxID=28002 RepID=A0AA86QWY7_9EUKA|nr:Hypothetical protein HINF_LOCUS46645 [Hexamita inflata]